MIWIQRTAMYLLHLTYWNALTGSNLLDQNVGSHYCTYWTLLSESRYGACFVLGPVLALGRQVNRGARGLWHLVPV